MAKNSEPIRVKRLRDIVLYSDLSREEKGELLATTAFLYYDRMADILDALAHCDSTEISTCVKGARELLSEMGQQ